MKITAFTHVDRVPYYRMPNVKQSVLEVLRYKILQQYTDSSLSILYNEPNWSTELITEEELPYDLKCESHLKITMSVQSF